MAWMVLALVLGGFAVRSWRRNRAEAEVLVREKTRQREAALAEERTADAARVARELEAAREEERRHWAVREADRLAHSTFRMFIADFPRFRAAVIEGLACQGVALDFITRHLGERLVGLLPPGSPVRVLGVEADCGASWKAVGTFVATAPTPEALHCQREVCALLSALPFASPEGEPWPAFLQVSLGPVQYMRDPGHAPFTGAVLRLSAPGLGYEDTLLILAYGEGSITPRYLPELDGPVRFDDAAEGV